MLPKKPSKDQRERLVLLGLVELYLETGKPVGSNTLRENGFGNLSSATIRNYFAKLEEDGYLKQQHSSGGRIPTDQAYKAYAAAALETRAAPEKERLYLQEQLGKETREIVGYLQHAAEALSEATRCAVFLSAPRFDQDFVLDVKLVGVDHSRCLCILITDFGQVHTEMLFAEKKLTNFTLKRIEAYFHWRLTGLDQPALSPEEEALATRFYGEAMLRHIVSYTHFSAEDIYKTGFSRLLSYPDFNDASALANGLSLLENPHALRNLLNECLKRGSLSFWIGDDLSSLLQTAASCSVLAAPYKIHQTSVGALALLGPSRIPYRQLFGLLQTASDAISEALTRSLYKFKISFRRPHPRSVDFQQEAAHCLLLENKIIEVSPS
jgi:heat-inducible transcriptional repressor